MKKYILSKTPKTHCLRCLKPVYMLAPEDVSSPAFYICFDCEFVGQIGVGEIEKEK